MVVDPFLKKKWDRVFFTFFDTNRNKVIDWNDFEVVFEKIKELRGEQSAEYKIVSDAMRTVWQGVLHQAKNVDIMHLDKLEGVVQEVTVDEWTKIWEKFDPNHMPIWQWEYLKYMFFLIDTSGDKCIDVDEYTTVMKIYGMTPSDAKTAFKKFAVDANGKPLTMVDYGQFVKLWNEYFTSTDKKKPGNYLFGDW